MKTRRYAAVAGGWVIGVGLLAGIGQSVRANGGPFVVKYPGGDPAAKGVLARLEPDLKPAHEERLKVVKEDLSIVFAEGYGFRPEINTEPLVTVKAEYTILNPLDKDVDMEFGFPILRGIYVNPYSMMPLPDVHVMVDGKPVKTDIISNSAIYGIIRKQARESIEQAVEKDTTLSALLANLKKEKSPEARQALSAYLTGTLKWNERDAALMAEYPALDLGKAGMYARDREHIWLRDAELNKLIGENLGTLAAIGEKKATQFLAQLSGLLTPGAGAGYESIFGAWGGDVRERSVDLDSGKIRPREITLDTNDTKKLAALAMTDPTIYARVDYLDPNAKLTADETAACKAILKNLPVVFTFAPMNLLHYAVKFEANKEKKVTVTYSQYAYLDTAKPASHQLSYVIHPASLWKEFGPIHLTVSVPDGVKMSASVACAKQEPAERDVRGKKIRFVDYTATMTDKTGELFVGIDSEGWKTVLKAPEIKAVAQTSGKK